MFYSTERGLGLEKGQLKLYKFRRRGLKGSLRVEDHENAVFSVAISFVFRYPNLPQGGEILLLFYKIMLDQKMKIDMFDQKVSV